MKRVLALKHSLNEQYFVASVKNALRILRLFTPKQNTLGISEISRHLNLPKSTVHRYVKELVQEGFLTQNPSNDDYHLGFSIISLGGIVQTNKEIYSDARPILVKLAKQFNIPAHICVMERNHVVYLMREMSEQSTKLITKSGRYNDLHCTAEGLAILAFKSSSIIENVITQPLKKYTDLTIIDSNQLRSYLLQIHYEHIAITKGTYAEGFTSYAVPIQDYTGEVVSSLALIGESKYFMDDQKMIPALKKAGKEVSEILGYYDG